MSLDDLNKLLDFEQSFFQVDSKLDSHMKDINRDFPYLSNSFNVLSDLFEQPVISKTSFDLSHFVETVDIDEFIEVV